MLTLIIVLAVYDLQWNVFENDILNHPSFFSFIHVEIKRNRNPGADIITLLMGEKND
jgi:hypothetical protein